MRARDVIKSLRGKGERNARSRKLIVEAFTAIDAPQPKPKAKAKKKAEQEAE